MKIRNVPKYILHLIGVRRDEAAGFTLLAKVGAWLCPGYRFTWPSLDWFKDQELVASLSKFGEEKGFNTHRRYALSELLKLISDVPGDTAECGVYRGCSSYLMLKRTAADQYDRTHHVFDSFEGLSKPEGVDGVHWSPNDLSIPEDVVRNNLKEFPSIELHKGWIPNRFGDVADRRFSAVHVDVDLYQPTLDSVSFFYERLNPGGVFVCDDYRFSTCPGATKAMDEFLADKPECMIGLAGGGGFFIKRGSTAIPGA